MATEQEKTISVLQTAIQMEIDGKKFYLKAGEQSSNELGKNLLKSLAEEEDIHRQKFEQIYEAIRSKEDWPALEYQPDGGSGLRTIFSKATEAMDTNNVNVTSSELDAVQTAISLENKTYEFYKSHGQKATRDAERNFYEALTSQEREHRLILLDYYEFLKDPASWFVEKEHPSLDGG